MALKQSQNLCFSNAIPRDGNHTQVTQRVWENVARQSDVAEAG